MKPAPAKKLEFIAKTIVDIGKAIFAVGLASYFFEKFDFEWRLTWICVSIGLIALGTAVFPENGGGDT